MIEQDTIKLLRECDAGIAMGITSIDEVMPYAGDDKLKQTLHRCRAEHDRLGKEVEARLHRFGDEGKNPNPVAKTMYGLSTGIKLTLNESDQTIAGIMTDGCNMGVKSLNRYLNQYEAAEEYAKDITKRLINLEQRLTEDVRAYL